jgi:hypothetical protein
MYTLIVLFYVMYGNTTVSISQTVLPERYSNAEACDKAGTGMTAKPAPNAPLKNGINDLRLGYICIESGTAKPLAP